MRQRQHVAGVGSICDHIGPHEVRRRPLGTGALLLQVCAWRVGAINDRAATERGFAAAGIVSDLMRSGYRGRAPGWLMIDGYEETGRRRLRQR